jgi:hypothetical protein
MIKKRADRTQIILGNSKRPATSLWSGLPPSQEGYGSHLIEARCEAVAVDQRLAMLDGLSVRSRGEQEPKRYPAN